MCIRDSNKITGTFPLALCDVQTCSAKDGNDLVAPCGTTGCCDLDDGETCSSSGGGEPTTPTPADSESDEAAAADLAALAAALAGVVMLA